MKLTHLFLVFILIGIISCKPPADETPEPPISKPAITVNDLEVMETDETQDVSVLVTLDKASEANVIVDYATIDGSATSPLDFRAIESTQLILLAGETEKTVSIRIKGDQTEEQDENFELTFFNPVNASLAKANATVTIKDDDDPNSNVLVIPTSGYDTPNSYEGMTLVWEDDFTGDALNLEDWTFEIGTGNGGWGNNELQYYRSQNTTIEESDYLVIEARNEGFGGSDYTSSRIVTEGKQQFQYGRVDIRAAMPEGRGLWPALWMLGENFQTTGWPMCGEMDIMELVGHQAGRTHSTVHFGDSFADRDNKGDSKLLPDGAKFSEEFHVFSLVWEENSIQFLLDDELVKSITPTDMDGQNYPFNQPFFFIFNVAVGGNWPGDPDSTTSFPQRMIVDYVRVFQ